MVGNRCPALSREVKRHDLQEENTNIIRRRPIAPALPTEGMLKGKNLTDFIQRSTFSIGK